MNSRFTAHVIFNPAIRLAVAIHNLRTNQDDKFVNTWLSKVSDIQANMIKGMQALSELYSMSKVERFAKNEQLSRHSVCADCDNKFECMVSEHNKVFISACSNCHTCLFHKLTQGNTAITKLNVFCPANVQRLWCSYCDWKYQSQGNQIEALMEYALVNAHIRTTKKWRKSSPSHNGISLKYLSSSINRILGRTLGEEQGGIKDVILWLDYYWGAMQHCLDAPKVNVEDFSNIFTFVAGNGRRS